MTSRSRAPSPLIEAARAFNAGRYFEAHEILEDGLDAVPDECWDLYIGLIQIAVGYHKLTQRLWSAAARMLASGLEKLAGYPGVAGGVRLDPLRQRVQADLDRLRLRCFDRAAFADQPPRLQPLRARD